jgi:riboflavin synthase
VTRDDKKRRPPEDDEIDPDAAPDPQPFQAPKGLHKVKPEGGEVPPVKSGAGSRPPPLPPQQASRPNPPRAPGRPAAGEDIDPDNAPAPKPFQAPKGLMRMAPEAPAAFELKSGAGPAPTLPPAPPPRGAEVRVHKPTATPAPPAREGEVDVRMQKPTGGPKPHIPTPEDMGEVDVKIQKSEGPKAQAEDLGPVDVQMQKGAPKLPKMEPVGEFDVVKPAAVPQPHPALPTPSPLEGPVDVIIDNRRQGGVDVTGQIPDPFNDRKRIGIVDTTFARYNMGDSAEAQLTTLGGDYEVVRRTVPGIKDLAVECKLLIEKHGCEIVLACGMVGAQPIDKTCAHEASMAIQWTQLATNHHILEVFVHADEAKDEKQLAWLMDQRTREHAENAWAMVFEPERLRTLAGKGLRQGFQDEGPVPLP